MRLTGVAVLLAFFLCGTGLHAQTVAADTSIELGSQRLGGAVWSGGSWFGNFDPQTGVPITLQVQYGISNDAIAGPKIASQVSLTLDSDCSTRAAHTDSRQFVCVRLARYSENQELAGRLQSQSAEIVALRAHLVKLEATLEQVKADVLSR